MSGLDNEISLKSTIDVRIFWVFLDPPPPGKPDVLYGWPLIYINDILDNIESEGFLFADDTKIFKTFLRKEDAEVLKSDLGSLEAWSNEYSTLIQRNVIHLGKLGNTHSTKRFRIYDSEHMFEEKDLVVTIDMLPPGYWCTTNLNRTLAGQYKYFLLLSSLFFPAINYVIEPMNFQQIVIIRNTYHVKYYRNL